MSEYTKIMYSVSDYISTFLRTDFLLLQVKRHEEQTT